VGECSSIRSGEYPKLRILTLHRSLPGWQLPAEGGGGGGKKGKRRGRVDVEIQ